MSKISTYPFATPPTLSDYVIGTTPGNSNATKNFRISDILTLGGANLYVPYTGATGSVTLGAYNISANQLIKIGGTSSEFLKANGSVDSNTYVTSAVALGFVPYTGATGNVTLGTHSITSDSFIKQGGVSSQFLKADGSIDSTTYLSSAVLAGYVPYTGATTSVTLGSYNISATQIIKIGGTSSQFLKADGSIDSSTYLTSAALSAYVPYTGATGSITLGANNITANQFIKAGGTSSQFLKADGSSDSSSYVPYTGATGNVTLGANSITASSIIKSGGTSSQFLKADGSIDSSTYLTSASISGLVPYTGAVNDVTLGLYALTANNVSAVSSLNTNGPLKMLGVPGTIGQILVSQGASGAPLWSDHTVYVPYLGATGDVNIGVHSFVSNDVTGTNGLNTSGPIKLTGSAGTAGQLLMSNGAGVAPTWSSTVVNANYGLFAQTSDSTPVTATTVETTILGAGVGTLTVPANGFSIGGSFQASLDGIITCLSSATLHIRVKTLTGVILADTGIIAMEAATSKSWLINLYFTIRNIGGTTVASISSGGLFSYIKNSGINFEGYVLSTVNNTTFDTTINNTLVITAQWNSTNAGNSIFTRNFTLAKIY